jgi:hypothetical protein
MHLRGFSKSAGSWKLFGAYKRRDGPREKRRWILGRRKFPRMLGLGARAGMDDLWDGWFSLDG